MNVSYQWLKNYVDLHDISPQELAEKLTNSGIAVDVVEKVNVELDKVVVGYVLERERHPEADKLSICKVDVGEEDALQIICGASNVDKGQKVPVALVGAKLPDGTKIKKAKLRGVESIGMICSSSESMTKALTELKSLQFLPNLSNSVSIIFWRMSGITLPL